MDLREEIRMMHDDENLTVGEIAGALQQDPDVVYDIVYRQK